MKMFLLGLAYRLIKNWLKASLVLHAITITDNEKKLKQNAERYGVRKLGSPIEPLNSSVVSMPWV